MKKNDFILAASIALYSFLFYAQSFGVNFLLFSLALVILLIIRNAQLLRNRRWLVVALGSILSGACVAYFGNTLSFVANIISLSLLSAYSLGESSLIFSLLFSMYSYCSSLVFVFLDQVERKSDNEEKSGATSGKKVILIGVPVLISIVFFFMYRGSNVLFNEFAKNINFDFISMNWIAFTVGGAILLYGFFHFRPITALATYDQSKGNILFPGTVTSSSFFGKALTVVDENFSGIVLFIILNTLLLIVNGLDLNFLFVDGKLPAGLTYSEFVHQGTGMLITSIIAGILIILFYFRGAMNFYEKSPLLKFLSYLWIMQNVCMLFSTSFRNNMYISEYGLTYKRIGVYIYLFLTAIGLCTTIIKISKAKSNMYLFRVNSWIFYGLFIASCVFNWDRIITQFNIHKANQLEKKYLVDLPYSNLPQLYELRADSIHKHKEFVLVEELPDITRSRSFPKYDFEQELNRKLFGFVHEEETSDWRSSKLLAIQTLDELNHMQVYKTITNIDLASRNLFSLEGLQNFSSLKKLNLHDNYLTSLKGIEHLTQLEQLDLSSNPIDDYSSLYKLSHLKTLTLPYQCKETKKLQQLLPNTLIKEDA
jgi:hypothetical protein